MCVRGCDISKKAERLVTWGVQGLRAPNLFKNNYSTQEAENAVISQRNHPVNKHFSQSSRHDCMAAANASLGDLRT